MQLSAGTRLGSYEILASIGTGGFGEVYRGIDTRLNREVAIKIPRDRFPERFDREAIASLSHRNICTLYDVGPNYLAMELIEGPTLEDRLQHGALPLEDAWVIAIQIAEALDAAHEKGIVHGNLTPANIKIAPDGTVKVLDFGLTEINEPPAKPSRGAPALTLVTSHSGAAMGAAACMAPERARGRVTDKRADIWAFGVLLYEMVTGEPLFQSRNLADTLVSVVNEEPDLSLAPPQLRRLLAKCLKKDPKQRLRDIGDVWELLEADREVAVASTPRRARAPRLLVPPVALWIVAGALLLAFAALTWLRFRETPPALQAVEFPLEAPPDSAFIDPYDGFAPSPDGRSVVFAAFTRGANQRFLWLRSLDSKQARPLPGTDNGDFPAWSPDNKSLTFFAGGKLKRIDIAGGAPVILADAAEDPVAPSAAWNRQGVILFGSSAGLERVSASGGGATLLTQVDPAEAETAHGYPQFLPDGKRFLYFAASTDPEVEGIYAGSLDNPKERQLILRTSAKAVYVPPSAAYPGYLLFMQDRTLVAQRFHADSLKLEGDPVPVMEGVGLHPDFPNRAAFSASDSGMLMYLVPPAFTKRPVVWINHDGKQLEEAFPAANVTDIALSPGAWRMALVQKSSPSTQDIWVRELGRGVMTRVTFNSAADAEPVWSPDGQFLAFTSVHEDGFRQIYRKNASGAGPEERLTSTPSQKRLLDWSRDGRFLLYTEASKETNSDLMALPLDGDRRPIPVVRTPFREEIGAISPGGRWVAYSANDTGRFELYLQAFPVPGVAPGSRWQVSNGGAVEVKWRGDGNELYFESPDGTMLAAAIQALPQGALPQGVRAETPRVLFSAGFDTHAPHQFDVTADGQRFLLTLNPPGSSDANRPTVISNWQATLRK